MVYIQFQPLKISSRDALIGCVLAPASGPPNAVPTTSSELRSNSIDIGYTELIELESHD